MRPALVLWLLSQASAQEPPPNPLLPLADAARAAPPEFCADILLRVAASKRADPKWKRDLIEESFRTATQAQLRFARRLVPGIDSESQAAFAAAPHRLDALTLQSRAVEAMIPLDASRARALFELIPIPNPPEASCTDPWAPEVDSYYAVAVKIFERNFTEEDRAKDRHLQFLASLIGPMHSPVQVPALARMIQDVRVLHAERQVLLSQYAAALDHVSGSDRGFSVRGAEQSMVAMWAALSRYDLAAILPAMRSYLVRQLTGPRCSASRLTTGVPPAVWSFHSAIAKADPKELVYRKLSPEEMKPVKDDGGFKVSPFWTSDTAAEVQEALTFYTGGDPGTSDGEIPESAWAAHYQETLKRIESWKPDDESSPENYYCMKAIAYGKLVWFLKPGEARASALASFREFLERSFFDVKDRNLWFSGVKQLLDQKIGLEEAARSGNPVLRAYGQPVP